MQAKLLGPDLSEWHYPMVRANQITLFTHGSYARISVTIVGALYLHLGRPAANDVGVDAKAGLCGVVGDAAVQNGCMGCIDPTLQGLKPIALLNVLGELSVGVRDASPFK